MLPTTGSRLIVFPRPLTLHGDGSGGLNMGNRHWLAESERGVSLQIYLALIAARLLQRHGDMRPTKRMMERLPFGSRYGPERHFRIPAKPKNVTLSF